MQAIAEAHICLSAKDSAKGFEQLMPTLEIVVKMFGTASEQVAQVTYQVSGYFAQGYKMKNSGVFKNNRRLHPG